MQQSPPSHSSAGTASHSGKQVSGGGAHTPPTSAQSKGYVPPTQHAAPPHSYAVNVVASDGHPAPPSQRPPALEQSRGGGTQQYSGQVDE